MKKFVLILIALIAVIGTVFAVKNLNSSAEADTEYIASYRLLR